MKAIEEIRDKVLGDVFDYTQLMHILSHYSKPHDVVTILLKQQQIIRIKKGLYIFGSVYQHSVVSLEYIANIIYGPSVISLDYALSWYGLIPERVNTITSLTTGRSREFNTPLSKFTYCQLSKKRFSTGIMRQSNQSGSFLIANPLKALSDKVWTDSRFKPNSVSSYSNYLFMDLRIDETILKSFIDPTTLDNIGKAYSTRKINWLVEFLLNYSKIN